MFEMRPERHVVFVYCLILLFAFDQNWDLMTASVIFRNLSNCYVRTDEPDLSSWRIVVAFRCQRAKKMVASLLKK
jgi:hypothetical protein